jgi:hypothetical protein
MHAEKSNDTVARMARLLEISRSAFYAWSKRLPSKRAVRAEKIEAKIAWFHGESDEVSGAPRILADLREDGEVISRKTVAKAMRRLGLRGICPRQGRTTTVREGGDTYPGAVGSDTGPPPAPPPGSRSGAALRSADGLEGRLLPAEEPRSRLRPRGHHRRELKTQGSISNRRKRLRSPPSLTPGSLAGRCVPNSRAGVRSSLVDTEVRASASSRARSLLRWAGPTPEPSWPTGTRLGCGRPLVASNGARVCASSSIGSMSARASWYSSFEAPKATPDPRAPASPPSPPHALRTRRIQASRPSPRTHRETRPGALHH